VTAKPKTMPKALANELALAQAPAWGGRPPAAAEWLEADGLGGFASGPVRGPRTRRYHALLLAAVGGKRFVLVNGCEAALTLARDEGTFTLPLTVQSYDGAQAVPDREALPEGVTVSFAQEPWPTWTWQLADGTTVVHELVALHAASRVVLRWTQRTPPTGGARATLDVRPFLSGRDYHALHHENAAFGFAPEATENELLFSPYQGVPRVRLRHNGRYTHGPAWYRSFFYAEEAARGLDAVEDLAAPGVLTFALDDRPAVLSFAAVLDGATPAREDSALDAAFTTERTRRARFLSPLHRAADQYLVARDGGRTIIAGYPWFTDWGRDTFIAVRGLCLAAGAYDDARDVLLRWAGVVSGGMLPNRFPDGDAAPEYNAVDAALWYVIAASELLAEAPQVLSSADRQTMAEAIAAILEGHARGTRYGIRVDADGLLAAGEPGVQLTWMDAKIGDWVVTPRVGKPVEIQALWLNALAAAERWELPTAARWQALRARGTASFRQRFWNPERGCLFDVVDQDHVAGRNDGTVRPNQIFAIGGLPVPLLDGERARAVVEAVEAHLLTPLGLRSLAPFEPGYRPRYDGDMRGRDSAYHQGTVWPWLMGPFVEAWLRVRGGSPTARALARARFLAPLEAHLQEAGVGHISEVADADAPHTPGGCPFQAWSLGELIRAEKLTRG